MHAWLKFEGYSSKNEAATPLRSSKLKWAWRAQFLSHNLQILWKFIFFESLQMIVKPSLAISNSIEFGKKWSSPPSMCKGVLALGYESACPGLRKNFRPLSMPWEALSIPRSPFSPAKTSLRLVFGNWASLRSWNEKFLSRHEKFAFSFATTWTLTFLPYRTIILNSNEFSKLNTNSEAK